MLENNASSVVSGTEWHESTNKGRITPSQGDVSTTESSPSPPPTERQIIVSVDMPDNGTQAQFLTLLLEGKSVEDAAKVVGVSRRTGYRWFSDPTFLVSLHSGQRQIFEATTTTMIGMVSSALSRLNTIITDPATSPAVATRAVDVLLSHISAYRLGDSLDSRLALVERLSQTF